MTEWNPTHAQIPKLAQAKGTNSLDVCTPVALDGTVCPLEHCFHNTHTHCFLHCKGSLLSLQSNHPILYCLTLVTHHTCHTLHLSPTTPVTTTPVPTTPVPTTPVILCTCHPPHLSPPHTCHHHTPFTFKTFHPPHLSPSTLTTLHTYHPPHLPPSTPITLT